MKRKTLFITVQQVQFIKKYAEEMGIAFAEALRRLLDQAIAAFRKRP